VRGCCAVTINPVLICEDARLIEVEMGVQALQGPLSSLRSAQYRGSRWMVFSVALDTMMTSQNQLPARHAGLQCQGEFPSDPFGSRYQRGPEAYSLSVGLSRVSERLGSM
jgi:hypothetical protein